MPNPALRRAVLLIAVLCLLPITAPAAPLDATDATELRKHVGEQVEIRGTPTGSGQSKTGTVGYLNFAPAHQGVALVFFFKSGQSGVAGAEVDIKPFVGKPIIVSGKLEDYKGDLQIKVNTLDQLKPAP